MDFYSGGTLPFFWIHPPVLNHVGVSNRIHLLFGDRTRRQGFPERLSRISQPDPTKLPAVYPEGNFE